ncbi:MAG: HDIG domain-containing protein [Defluviitaleaceae bacterium]|nr:HDIG domain-containing protein [Defluviitaleaceae bacterium]
MSKIPTREEAYQLLTQYTKSESLIKHALSVEGVMRHYAKKLNEDVEYWGAVALMHDLDYEQYPDQHCKKVVEILEEHGIDSGMIRSIVSHGYNICSDVEPTHIMEKVLYTIDELTGLVTAAALMRPSKSVMDLEYSSLWKKYKNVKFAAGVDRAIIEKGCQMWDADLKEVIEEVIVAMRGIADDIGLG